MSNYETSLKVSFVNLSDEEISKKLKTGNLSDEARVVAERVLNEREFGDNKSMVKEQAHQTELESPVYLSSEQNKKYVKGNVIVWMVTLFLIGAGLLDTTAKNIIEFKFFNGLIFSFIGLIFYLIYLKFKTSDWTTDELRNTYKRNFLGALLAIGIALISIISTINLHNSAVMVWLKLVVLSIIFMMYMKSKKSANYAFAIYSLIPITSEFLFRSSGSTIFWAFGFFVAAQSILIDYVINSESIESA